ncbi:REC8 meiotic recombination protein b [Periophthalmus magnuspinnatus]|uniref:REC8 meiotic recombination protein b n=1 Tax=Periophthalmus magnuspinnatus TaxID=409849 RepID=UPI0024362E44|nr:REC8 meiotic recombination protein b [Periophthalmus magnuspinnatus]
MFYYPNVLQRHSGCFSTIWLAATKGVKVTRRELLRVNVKKTCVDILNYITAQVPPPQQNLPKPRFSLYLSSQLQYGVVVVYHRQCGFLLDEIQQIIDRLLRSKKSVPIDIPASDRLALDLPDNLCMMEQAEGALDPFFGLMESHQLPSPYKVNQPGLMIEDLSAELSLEPSSHITSEAEGFRSPPTSITLREKEQFVLGSAEHFEGADLPEATNRELDLLMDERDQFRHDLEEQLGDGKDRSRDLMSSIDQLRESVVGPHRDSVWLQDEDMGQTEEQPKAPLPQEMTPVHVKMPSSPTTGAEELIARPVQKPGGPRKRQLVFADPEVQISNKEMKERIENPQAETLNLSDVLVNLAFVTKYSTPAKLFSAPCGNLIHFDLKALWKTSAVLTSITEPEEEEEQEREIMMTEGKKRHSAMKEMSSDSGLQPVDRSSASDLVLDGSKEDVFTPVSRWSPQEELQLVMEPIAEENIEMPEEQREDWICSHLQRSGQVTFDSLLPPKADRSTAAHTLCRLLELLSAGRVKAQQAEPYDQILVCSS